MRLIDADALIEGYKHMGYDPTEHPEESYMEGWCKGFNSAIDHCMHHVIHAPTVGQPEPKWTPCSERLPETYGAYLVQDVCGGIFVDYWRGYWLAKTTMVAWMELPEAYKGGDAE